MRTNALTLAALSLATASLSPAAEIHALDYDTPAYIDFELSEISVREDQKLAVVNIYRSGDFRQSTRLSYSTAEVTATEGKDYQGTGGTLTFQPGEGMKQVEIPLIADTELESEETFEVVLSEPGANALLLRSSILVKIQDVSPPEALPELRISSAGEGWISLSWEGSDTYRLERTVDAGTDSWELVQCTPLVANGRCEVTQSAGGIVYLYRLRTP